MEITMTLAVNPAQAEQIARLLNGNPAPAPHAPLPVQQPAPATQPVQTAPPQQMPVQPPVAQQAPAPQPLPTQVRTYTVQDLALACRPLMEAGKQSKLHELLAEFGATAGINSIPENRRAEFAARLREMGGQI